MAEVKFGPVGIEFELFIFAFGGVLLIGTREEALVAAEESVGDFLGEFRGYAVFVFDC